MPPLFRIVLSCFAVGLLFSVSAQEHFGIMGSTRAPANTMLLNPSSICDSRAFVDIHLIGAGAFAQNDFVYLNGDNFSLGNLAAIDTVDFNRSKAPFHAYASGFVQGPGATFAIKQHAFGIYTGARTVVDARGIPESLSDYIIEGFQYPPLMGQRQNIRNVRTSGLAWGEIGLSYATIVGRRPDMLTLGGITVKKLYGIMGAGVLLDEWAYTVIDSSTMQTHSLRGEYGFNEPAWNSGSGWGFDIGVTFKKMLRNAEGYTPHDPCTDGDYKYRLGFSILDIGRIKFKNTFYRNVFDETEGSQWEDFNDTNTDETYQLDSLISANFGLIEQNAAESQFKMKLPTGLSAQLDYNLGYNFYVFSTLTLGLPRKNSLGVQRASSLAVTPRWEIKRFEIAMPLSLYQFEKFQMGLACRLNSVIIGSDNLGWLFGSDVYGADVYVHVKYTIFRHWKCSPKKKKAPLRKKSKGSTIPCPSW
jgi:hypothetical protein